MIYKQRLSKLENNWHDGYKIESNENDHPFLVGNGLHRLRLNKQYIKTDGSAIGQGDVVG